MLPAKPKDANDYDIGLLGMVASGTATPQEIADIYGMELAKLDQLAASPMFRQAVEGVRADLMKNGSLISMRAGFVIAEVAIPEMQALLQGHDTEPGDKVKAAMALVKMQEIGNAGVSRGTNEAARDGVSITINTNPVMIGRVATPVEPVIEVTATEIKIGSD